MNPIHAMLKPLLNGYEIGMQTGDVVRALHNLNCYLQAAMVAGRSLTVLEADCRMFVRQMREFKQDLLEKFSSCLWQMVLNLMGHSKNTTVLTGEAMEEETEIETSLHQAMFQTYKLQLYVWFGDHEQGAELAISKGDSFMKASPGSSLCYIDNFMRGISLFHMARSTKKAKYKKHAKLVLAKVRKWVEKGNPNVVHHEALLEAEMAALRGKKYNARKQYEIATVLASRQGFIHDAAMANERYGEFLLNDMLDREEAAYRLEEAVKLYKEWGAHAKADILLEKYADLWPKPSQVVTMG
jgi:hypothetical protein